jgi:D-alanyl-D-alanine carboxypeptidase
VKRKLFKIISVFTILVLSFVTLAVVSPTQGVDANAGANNFEVYFKNGTHYNFSENLVGKFRGTGIWRYIAPPPDKSKKFSKKFVPKDLVNIAKKYKQRKGETQRVRKEAYTNFKKLAKAAKQAKQGELLVNSAFRSYSLQKSMWSPKVDNRVARPGYSEHQSGLAIDFSAKYKGGTNVVGYGSAKKMYTWLKKNSYKYGFILRYPKGATKITHCIFEPWHYRFVGKAMATLFYKSGFKTYDEFYQRINKNYRKAGIEIYKGI